MKKRCHIFIEIFYVDYTNGKALSYIYTNLPLLTQREKH